MRVSHESTAQFHALRKVALLFTVPVAAPVVVALIYEEVRRVIKKMRTTANVQC